MEWRVIEEFPNYEVSDCGQVRNKKTGHILKQPINPYGYYYLNLCKNGKPQTFRVHRLVAEAFIPNPNNLPLINHKDENKLNNNVDNLEWCDYLYNNTYGEGFKSRCHKIEQYDLNGNYLASYNSLSEASRQTGTWLGSLSQCLNGKQYTAGGYKWKKADVE